MNDAVPTRGPWPRASHADATGSRALSARLARLIQGTTVHDLLEIDRRCGVDGDGAVNTGTTAKAARAGAGSGMGHEPAFGEAPRGGVRSPSGWVHPVLYSHLEPDDRSAPGAAWRHRSQQIEQVSRHWSVRTLASRYRLNLAAGTVSRLELDEADRAAVDAGFVPHNLLTGDGDPLILLAVFDCRLEQPMVLLLDYDLDVNGQGKAGTIRVTTPVIAINAAPSEDR